MYFNMPKKIIITLFALFVYLAFSLFYYERWKVEILGGGDTFGYYLYLPAIFIHNDLSNIKSTLAAKDKYQYQTRANKNSELGIYELHQYKNGNQINKYTCGVALLQSPFFFVAHIIANNNANYKADGFSEVYRFFILFSGLFYTWLALIILAIVLSRIFEDKIVITCLIIVALATNLYFFSVFLSSMSHAYLFFLYALLIYATQNFYTTNKIKGAFLIGFSCGFITLIRPTEIICILIPIFYGIASITGIKNRILSLFKNPKFYFAIIIAICIGFIQLYYWKSLTGNWLHYSYNNEGFNFLKPKIKQGLFYFKNGWLAYTPIMYFALFGIYFMRKDKKFLLPILLFIPLHIYVIYSWHCWNYINGFGSRPMVETYALLSIPLGFSLKEIFATRYFKYLCFAVMLLFFSLNQFNTYQFSKGLLWSEEANFNFYKTIFFKTKLNRNHSVVYDSGVIQPNEEKLKQQFTIVEQNFKFNNEGLNILKKNENDNFLRLAGNSKTYIIYENEVENLKENFWIKVSFDARSKKAYGALWDRSYLQVSLLNNKKTYGWKSIRIENKIQNNTGNIFGGTSNVWDNVQFFYKVSKKYRPTDILKITVDSNNVSELDIDNVKVEVFIPN